VTKTAEAAAADAANDGAEVVELEVPQTLRIFKGPFHLSSGSPVGEQRAFTLIGSRSLMGLHRDATDIFDHIEGLRAGDRLELGRYACLDDAKAGQLAEIASVVVLQVHDRRSNRVELVQTFHAHIPEKVREE